MESTPKVCVWFNYTANHHGLLYGQSPWSIIRPINDDWQSSWSSKYHHFHSNELYFQSSTGANRDVCRGATSAHRATRKCHLQGGWWSRGQCLSLSCVCTLKREYLVAIIFGGFSNMAISKELIWRFPMFTGISKDWDIFILRQLILSNSAISPNKNCIK